MKQRWPTAPGRSVPRGKVRQSYRTALLHPSAACTWCCWPAAPAIEESREYRAAVRVLDLAEQRHGTVFFELVVDHIIPLDRGGTHEWANLRVLCHQCNLYKGPRLDAEVGGAAAVLTRRRQAALALIRRAEYWRRFMAQPGTYLYSRGAYAENPLAEAGTSSTPQGWPA